MTCEPPSHSQTVASDESRVLKQAAIAASKFSSLRDSIQVDENASALDLVEYYSRVLS